MRNIIFFGLLSSIISLNACKSHLGSTKADAKKELKQEIALYKKKLIPKDGEIFATADLTSKSGSKAEGKAWFIKDKNGIQIFIKVKDASPGSHGIHIHEKGDCSADDASSAGNHFNPAKLKHGSVNPAKHHMGDLGNISVGPDGTGVLYLRILESDFHPNFFDWSIIVGKSLILHSKADDLISQSSGKSGSRIACGVITKE